MIYCLHSLAKLENKLTLMKVRSIMDLHDMKSSNDDRLEHSILRKINEFYFGNGKYVHDVPLPSSGRENGDFIQMYGLVQRLFLLHT